jgi:hypothetical protein
MQLPGNGVLANEGWGMYSDMYVSKSCWNNGKMNYLCILRIDVDKELVLSEWRFWIVWPHLEMNKQKCVFLKSENFFNYKYIQGFK